MRLTSLSFQLPILKFFRDEQQFALFKMLTLASFFITAMLVYRWQYNRELLNLPHSFADFVKMRGCGMYFLFLLWNLFLAWIPYIAALAFSHFSRKNSGKTTLFVAFAVWLAFFPNAPYIVTDLVHLKARPPVPFWFDLVLLFSGAMTGLMLGLISLFEMQSSARKWLSDRALWMLTLPILTLCGFGVWLGRFQRWNSWDIVTNPGGLLRDLAQTLLTRHELVHALQITALLTAFLWVSYSMVLALMGRARAQA